MPDILFIESQQGQPQLIYNGFVFNRKIVLLNGLTSWRCSDFKEKCRAVAITKNNVMMAAKGQHCHKNHLARISNKTVKVCLDNKDNRPKDNIY